MKYRIWDKEHKKFLSKHEWVINGNGTVFYCDVMDGELIKANKKTLVVQLFTGMQDKHGKDIYEGDILKIHNHDKPEKVEYISDGSTAFGFFKHEDAKRLNARFEYLGDYTGSDGYEIIGNIFINDCLLTK